MRLLLITGAGASRNLNAAGSPAIALMDGWANALTNHLGSETSATLGLDRVATGQEFEELLGELTRWLDLTDLNMRFAPMTRGFDDTLGISWTAFEDGLKNAEKRGLMLEEALDQTLFQQFGPHRFDPEAAASAYKELLLSLRNNEPLELICATTNYDRSLEIALDRLGFIVRNGFRYNPIATAAKFSSAGLGTFSDNPSVMYLHGAVGWYRAPEGIEAYPAAEPYRPDLGRPAVLYPNKNKVVEESTVADIWNEFDRAVASSTHILVLGHSLNDSHLVKRLETVSAQLGVTIYSPEDEIQTQAFLPHATVLDMDFSSHPTFDSVALQEWLAGFPIPRRRPVFGRDDGSG